MFFLVLLLVLLFVVLVLFFMFGFLVMVATAALPVTKPVGHISVLVHLAPVLSDGTEATGPAMPDSVRNDLVFAEAVLLTKFLSDDVDAAYREDAVDYHVEHGYLALLPLDCVVLVGQSTAGTNDSINDTSYDVIGEVEKACAKVSHFFLSTGTG